VAAPIQRLSHLEHRPTWAHNRTPFQNIKVLTRISPSISD